MGTTRLRGAAGAVAFFFAFFPLSVQGQENGETASRIAAVEEKLRLLLEQAGELQREVGLTGADRFIERLAREVDVLRLCLREGRKQLRGARMVASHRRGSRLHVG